MPRWRGGSPSRPPSLIAALSPTVSGNHHGDPLADECDKCDGRIDEKDGDLVAATLSQSLSWKSCERMLRKKMQNKEIPEKFWCQLRLREDQAHPVYITASRSSYPCLWLYSYGTGKIRRTNIHTWTYDRPFALFSFSHCLYWPSTIFSSSSSCALQQVHRDEVVKGGRQGRPPQSSICFWWIAKGDVTPDASSTLVVLWISNRYTLMVHRYTPMHQCIGQSVQTQLDVFILITAVTCTLYIVQCNALKCASKLNVM